MVKYDYSINLIDIKAEDIENAISDIENFKSTHISEVIDITIVHLEI